MWIFWQFLFFVYCNSKVVKYQSFSYSWSVEFLLIIMCLIFFGIYIYPNSGLTCVTSSINIYKSFKLSVDVIVSSAMLLILFSLMFILVEITYTTLDLYNFWCFCLDSDMNCLFPVLYDAIFIIYSYSFQYIDKFMVLHSIECYLVVYKAGMYITADAYTF